MSQDVSMTMRTEDIPHIVERVYATMLTGVPRVFAVDAAAIWGKESDDQLATAIVTKMSLLAQQNAMRMMVRGVDPRQAEILERAIPTAYLLLELRTEGLDALGPLPGPSTGIDRSIAVLALPSTGIPDSCMAFYVGDGDSPPGSHATHIKGAQATDVILTLYGTALVQERAGIAFRTISEGKSVPREANASLDTLAGVVRSVERREESRPTEHILLPGGAALRALAARAYGRLVPNVLATGAVVGSPARGEKPGQPNYWFYWQRDGSVTMGHLIEWQRKRPLGLEISGLDQAIAHYPDFVARMQSKGELGTSRYTIEGEPITGFGNPQLDGPPLSAMSLARMERPAQVWELLRGYLDFLLTPEGRGPSMDAWEFIYGWHFNAAFLKRRALLVGAAVAAQVGHADAAARYRSEARHVETGLADFMDRRLGRLRAFSKTYNPWFAQMSGLDMAMICALLSGRDLHVPSTTGGSQDPQRAAHLGVDLDSLTHPAVLATMSALEDAFASAFRVNREWSAAGNAGCGLGRFPEDANDGVGTNGGNPWPLATLWGAQFYYHVAREVAQILEGAPGRSIALDDERQIAFFQRAVGNGRTLARSIEPGTWREKVLPAVVARGDGYLNFVVQHLPEDGGVTEQIDRDTGAPRGARDLSWALSELIATIALREQVSAEI
jgi:glucoamylase